MFHIEQQLNCLSEINESLFLAGKNSLSDNIDLLTEYNITCVVNISNSPMKFGDTVKCLSIDIDDNVNENIHKHFDKFFEFMNDAHKAKSKVLIFCQYGMSRSASFVIAWLMKQQHSQGSVVSYKENYNQVKSIRSCVSPNPAFVKQLEEFAKELNEILNLYPSDVVSVITSEAESGVIGRLSCASQFFRRTFQANNCWEFLLKKDFDIDSKVVNLKANHNLTYKEIYSFAYNLNKILPSSLFLMWTLRNELIPRLIGYIGNEVLLVDYLNEHKDKEFDIVVGLIFAGNINLINKLSAINVIDILKTDMNNQNYLFFALHANQNKIFDVLHKKHSLSLSQVSKQKNNLLHVAAMSGNVDLFKDLVSMGFYDVAQRNAMGNNILHLSVIHKREAMAGYIVHELKDIDPDPDVKNAFGDTALSLARKSGNSFFVELLEIYGRKIKHTPANNITSRI